MIRHHVRLHLESSKQDRTLYFELMNCTSLQIICSLFCIFLHFKIHWNYFQNIFVIHWPLLNQMFGSNNITHEYAMV